MKGSVYRLRNSTNFLTEHCIYTVPKGRIVVQLEEFDQNFAPFLISKGVVAVLFVHSAFMMLQDFELIE